MNVRRHNRGRGERLDPGTLGMTGEVFVSVDGPFAAVSAIVSRKAESICASPTRY
jgi:hypothetical protein